jgi:murein DD-endopeptidase MepM/ murein hydrolase activator NlpD
MESMLLKQIVTSSGAFKGGEGAGSGVRADIFAQTLSDALAQGGGIGLARMLERSLGGGPPAPAAPPTAVAGLPAPPPRSPIGQLETRPPERGSTGLPVELSPPLPGARTTSPFGVRKDPISGLQAAHHGLDFAASGGASIEASAPGVVIAAGPRGSYGLAVEIDHGHGITTLYGHASHVLVQPGERVERGDPVALLGDTGRSTGPHLHFEVRADGHPLNPRQALNAYQSGVDKPLGSEALAPSRSP